jgi:hypothetical protein
MKFLALIQNEFLQLQSDMRKIAKKTSKRSVSTASFLKEEGDRTVKNPSSKRGKNPTIKIKSLKSGDERQKATFKQLYKQWLGSKSKKVHKKDKIKVKVKAKLPKKHIKQIKKELKKKEKEISKPTTKIVVDKELKEKKEETTVHDSKIDAVIESAPTVIETEKEIEHEEKADAVIDQEMQQHIDDLNKTGDKSNEVYKHKIEAVAANKDKLVNSVDMFHNPTPPKQRNIDELKTQIKNTDEAFDALGFSKYLQRTDTVDSPNFTTVHMKVTDPIAKANMMKRIVSSNTGDSISTFTKTRGVILSENLDKKKDYDFSIQLPKGFDIQDRDPVSFKELITSNEFTEARKNKPAAFNVPIGVNSDGQTEVIDFAKDVGVMIVGTTGSGKTVNLHSIINTVQHAYTPEEMKLVVIDPKNVELRRYAGSKYLAEPAVLADSTDIEFLKKVHKTLDHLQTEHMKRKKFLGEIQDLTGKTFENITDWNAFITAPPEKLDDDDKAFLAKIPEDKKKVIPRIAVCIDEMMNLLEKDNVYVKSTKGKETSVADHLGQLMAEVRSSNINFVGCTQSLRSELIAGRLKTNFKGRLVCRVSNEDEAAATGVNEANKLLPAGDMIYTGESRADQVRVQSGHMTSAENDKASRALKGPQTFIEQKSMKEIEQEKTEAEEKAKLPEEEPKEDTVSIEFRKRMDELRERLKKQRESIDARAKQLEEESTKTQSDIDEILKQRKEREKALETARGQQTGIKRQKERSPSDVEVAEPEEVNLEDLSPKTEPESNIDEDTRKDIDELTKTVPVSEVKKEAPKTETKITAPKTEVTPEKKKSLLDRIKKLLGKKSSVSGDNFMQDILTGG